MSTISDQFNSKILHAFGVVCVTRSGRRLSRLEFFEKRMAVTGSGGL
jgi:hypothetical protein